jgi:hypothetical protein
VATLNRTRIATANMARHGEPVTLADSTEIIALFNPGITPNWGLNQDLGEALNSLPEPSLQLTDSQAALHAAFLTPGLSITHNATVYRIAGPAEPDGHGLTRIPLMPAQDTSAPTATTGAPRWR